MSTIEDELESLQKQIEMTTDHRIRMNLFLKKVELLKLQEDSKSNFQKIVERLIKDLKKEV